MKKALNRNMKINWNEYLRHFNRPLTINQAQCYSWSCSADLEKILGKGLWHQAYVFNGDNADGYFLKKEWDDFNDYIYNTCFQDKDFLKNSNKKIEEEAIEIEKFFMSFADIDFSKLANIEVSKKLQEANIVLKTKVSSLWVGFILEGATEKKAIEVLKKYNLPINESLETIGAISRPHHIFQERIDLMKIVSSSDSVEEDLKKHHARYEYIPCYSVDVVPYTLEYFKERVRGISKEEAEKQIIEMEDGFVKAEHDLDMFIKSNSFEKHDELFIKYLHELSFFKDYRSHFRSLMMYYMRKLFLEIGKRYNLEISEISLLLGEEIVGLLENDDITEEIREIIKERSNRDGAYLFDNEKEAVISKEEMGVEDSAKDVKELKGVIANKGIVRGVVKVVMSPNNINKVEEGDVLVTAMTRPDFLPVMKKSGAIITDEGGMLCHAAIVSRELNKPCIIGTKNATKMLKDGDMVEVDADEGVVRIIE